MNQLNQSFFDFSAALPMTSFAVGADIFEKALERIDPNSKGRRDPRRDTYDYLLDGNYPEGSTAIYPLLYAQVTRRFKGFDIYVGGENLTNYTQPLPIISAADPYSTTFDAASVWGPLMGVKIYAGFRITIWK